MTATEIERLVAEGDEDGVGRGRHRLEADLERARQPSSRVRVDDPLLAAPRDGGLDGGGVLAEHDDDLPHPGIGERVEDVLEHRPAADRRQQLAAPEARGRARGEHQSDRRLVHDGIFPPPAGTESPSRADPVVAAARDHRGRVPVRRSPAPARASARPDPP